MQYLIEYNKEDYIDFFNNFFPCVEFFRIKKDDECPNEYIPIKEDEFGPANSVKFSLSPQCLSMAHATAYTGRHNDAMLILLFGMSKYPYKFEFCCSNIQTILFYTPIEELPLLIQKGCQECSSEEDAKQAVFGLRIDDYPKESHDMCRRIVLWRLKRGK